MWPYTRQGEIDLIKDSPKAAVKGLWALMLHYGHNTPGSLPGVVEREKVTPTGCHPEPVRLRSGQAPSRRLSTSARTSLFVARCLDSAALDMTDGVRWGLR
jgi:hypothetical protein